MREGYGSVSAMKLNTGMTFTNSNLSYPNAFAEYLFHHCDLLLYVKGMQTLLPFDERLGIPKTYVYFRSGKEIRVTLFSTCQKV